MRHAFFRRSAPSRRFGLLAVLMAGTALGTAGAVAAIDTQAQKQVQHWLDHQPTDGTRLTVTGPVSAHVDGNHLSLTLPGAQLHLGNSADAKPGDGPRLLDLGTLTVVASPAAGGGWDLTTTLPPRIPVRDAAGATMGELSAARQSVHGHLTTDGTTLDAADVSLGSVTFQPTPGHDAYQIASLDLRMKPDRVDATHWSGPVHVTVTDAAVHEADGGDWTLRQGALHATVSDFNLAQAALLRGAGARAATGDKALDGLMSHLKATLALAGLGGRDANGEPYALKDLNLDLNVDGDGSRVALDYSHHGLAMTASDGGAQLPADGRLRLVARDLPVEAVAGTWLADPVPAGGGKQARHARQERRGHLADDLAAAGTRLTLDALDFQAPTVGVAAHGTLNFSDKDPLGMDGALDLRTRGLQALSGKHNGAAALTFFAFDALGQQGTDTTGRPVRAYDLVIGKDGRIQLNGNEATALVTGLSKLL